MKALVGLFVLAVSCFAGNLPVPTKPAAQKVKVRATITKIECLSAYDGKRDKTEEVYGEASINVGLMCFAVDYGDLHPAKNYQGDGKFKILYQYPQKMRKGDKIDVQKSATWEYNLPLPTNCDFSSAYVLECKSNLDEKDMPSDADDKLEQGECANLWQNHYCSDIVYLNSVMNIGKKNFNFKQIHASGGTKLAVYFTAEITTQ